MIKWTYKRELAAGLAKGTSTNSMASGESNIRRKTGPGREFRAHRLSRPQGKVWNNIKRNCRAFCDSLMRFIHSQIIIATSQRPSHTSPGVHSLSDALLPNNSRRPTPHQPTQFSYAAKRPRRVPVDAGPRDAAEGGNAHVSSECVRAERDAAAERYRMASMRGRCGNVDFDSSHREFGSRI
jgi:hypothetical protein